MGVINLGVGALNRELFFNPNAASEATPHLFGVVGISGLTRCRPRTDNKVVTLSTMNVQPKKKPRLGVADSAGTS